MVFLKEKEFMTNEPAFWDDKLKDEPICSAFVEKFDKIYLELSTFVNTFAHWECPYPRFKVEDPKTNKKVPLYNNNWNLIPISLIDEENSIGSEFIRFKEEQQRQLGVNLEQLIKKYRKRVLPTTHSIIWEPERDKILANAFISKILPGTIINPHKGYCEDYMRVHLGLITDEGASITVGEETRTWQDGELLAFKDGGPYYHSVKHEGKNERYILSFDLKIEYLKQYVKEL